MVGTYRIEIIGSLADVRNNLDQFFLDLVSQGIDTTPIKNLTVDIKLSQGSIQTATADKITAAINQWRTQVIGTTIVVSAEYDQAI